MSGNRVLFLTLSERTSSKGNTYLAGWCGKAKLVGFKADEPDQYGNPVWNIYATEPEPRADGDKRHASSPRHSADTRGGYEDQPQQRRAQGARAQAVGNALAGPRDWTPEPLPDGGDPEAPW